ncbi:hypothetical protein LCGC14_0424990, partial [marine sediment metagenome]
MGAATRWLSKMCDVCRNTKDKTVRGRG